LHIFAKLSGFQPFLLVSSKTQASSYRALAERYPSIDFFVVDALAHPAVLAEAEVSRLPPAGTPLFLFYEAAEGCVDAVVGEDGSDLGRTLKLFNPGPGTEPSSPLSSRSPAESWMFPASPVVGMNVRWGAEEDWEGSGFVGFA